MGSMFSLIPTTFRLYKRCFGSLQSLNNSNIPGIQGHFDQSLGWPLLGGSTVVYTVYSRLYEHQGTVEICSSYPVYVLTGVLSFKKALKGTKKCPC